jgi:hypothetical protein
MTTYFFDEKESKLIAYDADTKELHELLPVSPAGSEAQAEQEAERRPASPPSRHSKGQQPNLVAKTKAGCNECACGEGIPCACNDSTPPDTSQVIVIDEVTLH